MSTRDYPVFDYGLVLDFEGFLELLKSYNGKFEDIPKEELDEMINNEDYGYIDELVYGEFSIFYSISAFDGEFGNIKGDYNTSFTDETIYVLGLEKFNIYNNQALFTKYDNEEETYKEIENSLESIGLKANMDFIIKHTGKVNGTYFG